MTVVFSSRSQCDGKVVFFDRRGARRVLRQMRGRGKNLGHMNVYRCPHCSLFHVGHVPQQMVKGEI